MKEQILSRCHRCGGNGDVMMHEGYVTYLPHMKRLIGPESMAARCLQRDGHA